MRSSGRIYWLWCCFTVFLAGCGHALTGAATPTLLTFATPTSKPTAALRLIRTPTLRASGTALAMVITPFPLTVEPPACYETAVASVWCFGLVRNTLTMPVEQVIVRVYLVTINGASLIEQQTTTANAAIMAGSVSPYGVLFNTMPQQTAGSVAMLDSAIPMPAEKQTRIKSLVVANVKYDNHDGVYDITASLTNSDNQPLSGINVVITLLTVDGRVTGFRKQEVPQTLGVDESFLFNTHAIPQGLPAQRVEISAEGWR